MRIKSAILVCCVLGSVVGCRDTEETKTVEWYQANKEALAAKLEECKNNPGDLADTPNCKNASQASVLGMSGSSKLDYSKAFK